MLSVCLALSYSVMRSQTMSVQIQANSNLRVRAIQAARTGLAAGLHQMRQSTWAGVNTTLAGFTSNTDGYSVTYSTGDPSLTSANPNYADYPWRVTLNVVGQATDPTNPGVAATSTLQAVVRLSPRLLGPEPPDWPVMRQSTVYQASQGNFTIDVPCRIQGQVRMQGTLQLCQNVPSWSQANQQYMNDLGAMPLNGYPDYRPLTGPVLLQLNGTPGPTRWLLSSSFQVSTVDTPDATAASWSYPGMQQTYQLYPGGAVYQVPQLGNTLQNARLAADPLQNPLGLFYTSGDLTLENNVNLQGTLVADGTIRVAGTNVNLQAAALPALDGTTQPVSLPVLIAGNACEVTSAAWQTEIQGIVAAFNSFSIDTSSQAAPFDLKGGVVTTSFTVGPRQEWQLPGAVWFGLWQTFQSQIGQNQQNPVPSVPYFPVWLAQFGLNPAPAVTMEPSPTPVTYHWKNTGDPVYVANPADAGLRWDVLAITNGP